MRVHVVSDVHGNAEALRRAGDGADALVVLGDLVDFVDYHDPAGGILGRVLGPEVSARFGQLRAVRAPGRAGAPTSGERWAALPDPAAVVEEAVREQYAALFAAMTAPTYAIPGNVDLPAALAGVRPARGVPARRPGRRTIGGLRFGFVGGAPLPAGRERRTAAARGTRTSCAPRTTPRPWTGSAPVDVLCSHVPPAVPELAYDVVARRAEAPSAALLAKRAPRPAPGGAVRARPPAAGGPRCGSGAPSASTSATSADGHAVRAAVVGRLA